MTWPTHPAADLFPLLEGDELAALAADIAEHGLREPVWLWVDPDDSVEYLLDGRNRVAACEQAGVEIDHRWFAGGDPISFVMSENIHRRHLSAGQRCDVVWRANELRNGGPISLTDLACGESPVSSLAKQADVDRGTAKQFIDVIYQAPDLRPDIQSGEKDLNRAARIIRDRVAEERQVEKARKETAAKGVRTTVDIRHGDFRDVLADLSDVDAIITDPPYPREFIPLLGGLGKWADDVLAPDGVLAVLMGQSYLPEVYRLLEGGRPYRWTACYLTPGGGYASMARRLQSNWKPLIIYGGGPRFSDVIRSEGTDSDAKNNHAWGQDYSAFHTIIERLTEVGQTVVDPFMGSGTTLLAAHALGRNVIGCDINTDHVATTRTRLS